MHHGEVTSHSMVNQVSDAIIIRLYLAQRAKDTQPAAHGRCYVVVGQSSAVSRSFT